MLHFLQLFRPSPFPSLAGISFRLFFSFVGFFIILAFALVLSLSALVIKGLPTCHCPVAADPATAVLPFQPRLFPLAQLMLHCMSLRRALAIVDFLFGISVIYLNTHQALSKRTRTYTRTHTDTQATLQLQRFLLSYAGFVRQVPNEDNALLGRTQFYLSAIHKRTYTRKRTLARTHTYVQHVLSHTRMQSE